MATTIDVMAPSPSCWPHASLCLAALWDEEQLQVRSYPVTVLRSLWPSQAIHVDWERPGQSPSIWGTVAEHMQWLGRIILQPRRSNPLGGLLPKPQQERAISRISDKALTGLFLCLFAHR